VILWQAATGTKLQTFAGHTASVYSVAFSRDGRQVLTGADDQTAILWEAATGKQLRTFAGHTWIVRSVAFSRDGRQVLTGSWDKTAILWDSATGKQLRTFAGHASRVSSVAFSPDGRQVLTGAEDGTARLWETASGRELAQLINIDAGKDWLVITPQGYHDGSAGGRQFVHWRVGDTLFPPERYAPQYHRPDLVKKALAGEQVP
jgi:WD40 repeat protein